MHIIANQMPTIIVELFPITSSSYFFLWISVGFIFLMFELGHPGLFFFLSFFIGALSAACVGFFEFSFLMQCSAFVLGTIIAFFMLRYLIEKEQKNGYRSNVCALQGKEGIVLVAITQCEYGQVNVEGQVWRAQLHAAHEQSLSVNTRVRIIAVHGTRLMVEKI